jgi:hypothetical protein
MIIAQVLYKESYSFTDEKTGEIIQGGKVQIVDPSARINAKGKAGTPAFFLKAEFAALAQIPDDKLPGRFELNTVRVPRKDREGKDIMEERIVGAKLL